MDTYIDLICDLAELSEDGYYSDLLVLGRPKGWKGRGIISPADFTKRAEAAMR